MSKITNLLGDQAAFYLEHTCRTIDKSLIHIPSPNTMMILGYHQTAIFVP